VENAQAPMMRRAPLSFRNSKQEQGKREGAIPALYQTHSGGTS